jgi:AcrR family transcriptional regulator
MDGNGELQRRAAMLEAMRVFVEEHGLAPLTLEKAAELTGLSPAEFEEYFESKVDVVVALLAENRRHQRDAFARILAEPSISLEESLRRMWRFFTESEYGLRTFFEAYGMALQESDYQTFLHGTGDWLPMIGAAIERYGVPKARSQALATLVITVYRGLLMDLYATGERARTNAAMEQWIEMIAAVRPR